MTGVLVAGIVLCVGLMGANHYGLHMALAVALLGTLAVIPGRLYGTADPLHVGIAGGFPVVATYSVPIVVGAVLLAVRNRSSPIAAEWVPLSVYLLVALVAVWPHSSSRSAGALLLFTAILAWGLGSRIAVAARDDRRLQFAIAAVPTCICALQFCVEVVQASGRTIFQPDAATADLMEGRYNGTLDHPAEIGKTILLLTFLVLPLTMSSARRTRVAAWLIVPIGFAATLLTESRANMVSLVAVYVFWSILMPGRALGSRLLGLLIAAGCAVVAAPTLIARFHADPDGGARKHLMQVALAHIHDNLWFGVGPNAYVESFGPWDRLTASGWPVHNAVVLVLAELGIVGLVLFFGPLGLWLFRALHHVRGSSVDVGYARSMLIMVPGLYVVMVTGWGMLHAEMAPLLFLVAGFASQSVRTMRATVAADERPADAVASRVAPAGLAPRSSL